MVTGENGFCCWCNERLNPSVRPRGARRHDFRLTGDEDGPDAPIPRDYGIVILAGAIRRLSQFGPLTRKRALNKFLIAADCGE
jgi:hypothetical protein